MTTPTNDQLDELQEKCRQIQLTLNIGDGEWQDKFGNNNGLYGFVSSALSAQDRESRVEELESLQGAEMELWSNITINKRIVLLKSQESTEKKV